MPWRAWWWEKYIFICLPLFVPRVRGSLDNARDDGTRSGIFTRKDDLPRRFFATLWMTGLCSRWCFLRIVISTKRSAWRNPLRRSSGYPIHLIYHIFPQWIRFLIYSLFRIFSKQFGNPSFHTPTLSSISLNIFIPSILIYRCYSMLYLTFLSSMFSNWSNYGEKNRKKTITKRDTLNGVSR